MSLLETVGNELGCVVDYDLLKEETFNTSDRRWKVNMIGPAYIILYNFCLRGALSCDGVA